MTTTIATATTMPAMIAAVLVDPADSACCMPSVVVVVVPGDVTSVAKVPSVSVSMGAVGGSVVARGWQWMVSGDP
jgi:hypothetical protein